MSDVCTLVEDRILGEKLNSRQGLGIDIITTVIEINTTIFTNNIGEVYRNGITGLLWNGVTNKTEEETTAVKWLFFNEKCWFILNQIFHHR